jgi:acetoin utilization deacetylase AcuC-like enzyme
MSDGAPRRPWRAFSAPRESSGAAEVFVGDSASLEPHLEHPGRRAALIEGLARLGLDPVRVTDGATDEELLTVHDPGLIRFFREMADRRDDRRPRLPDSFPAERRHPPADLFGRYGYYATDTQTPFTDSYWAEALRSARCALDAADAVLAGANAYALCRPPGHHAGRAYFGGFCYLNNTALAANRLTSAGRVAVLDVDYHHGNGTQDCFYETDGVFTASIHADPNHEYPYFAGYADEIGTGAGTGANLNVPVPKDVSPADWFGAFDTAVAAITTYVPDVLVLAFGSDTFRGDPVGGLSLTPKHFRRLGERIRHLEVPTLVVQEGGYAVGALADILESLLLGLGAKGIDQPA